MFRPSQYNRLLGAACLGLAACGPYPRDAAGTLDAIERSRHLRIALAEVAEGRRPAALAFVERLAAATGSKAELVPGGSTEAQLAALEAGRIDLVIAEVAEDSPWLTEVAVIEPLAVFRVGERRLGLSAIARNGENRWIMLLEREARNAQARP